MPKLATKLTSSVLDKFERKKRRESVVRAKKEFILFISNDDMGDIIKIIVSLEKSGLLIDGMTETVKHEMEENNKVDFSVVRWHLWLLHWYYLWLLH